MVKPKKQSKRMPARKKYKIQRKVREHNRKMRKEAKARSKKLKKDPGIPNLFPFKEQLLQQMQARKERVEGERERQKLQRQREHAKKRRSLQGLKNDADKRQKEYERKEKVAAEMESAADRCGLQPDRSLRAHHREFRKVVEASDVVLEVLDARDPLGCRCLQVEQAVLTSGTNKRLILVLNKIDLVPKEVVEKWLKHLRKEFPAVAFKASTQTQKHNLSQKKFALGSGPTSLLGTSACLGAEVLLKLLGNYCRNADIKTSITVGVVGLPNVGKSSLINSLKRSRACSVGATPGVTKCLQLVQLDKHVKLLDSPGVVWAAADSGSTLGMILRNCVEVESVDPVPPVQAILRRCNKFQVLEHYCIPDFKDVHEFLCHLAHKMGRLKKGGVPDVEAAARSVLEDWNKGKITFYTHPPEQPTPTSHVTAEIVQQWGKVFDIDALLEEEREELKGLSGVKGEMMELEPSEPLQEALVEDDKEEDDDDDESVIEEDMDSELSTSKDGSEEEMEEEEEEGEGGVTVVLAKKPEKKAPPMLTKREVRELRRLHPQPAKDQHKALKRRERLVRQLERRCCKDKDGGVVLEDAYDFDEHFT